MESRYDVVVVGSGFGGGVTACRLAEQGMRVCVLERGRRFGPGDFPDRAEQAPMAFWHPILNPGGMLDLRLMKDLSVLTAAGVGGGSLVYANTHLRAPRAVFEQPHWPQAITRAELDPYDDRTEEAFEPQRRRPSRRCPRSAPSPRWPSAPGARRASPPRGALRREPPPSVQRRLPAGLPEPRALRRGLPGAGQEHRRHHLHRPRRVPRRRGLPAPGGEPSSRRPERAGTGGWASATSSTGTAARSRRRCSCWPPARSARAVSCSRTEAGWAACRPRSAAASRATGTRWRSPSTPAPEVAGAHRVRPVHDQPDRLHRERGFMVADGGLPGTSAGSSRPCAGQRPHRLGSRGAEPQERPPGSASTDRSPTATSPEARRRSATRWCS